MIGQIDPPPPEPVSPRLEYWRSHFIIWSVVLMIVLLPVLFFADNTAELYPNHSDQVAQASFAIAAAFGITMLAAMIIIKPAVRGSRLLATTFLPIAWFMFSFLTLMTVLDAIYQYNDFTGPDTVRGYHEFALDRVYTSTGKGSCYKAALADWPESFCISRTDFAMTKVDMRDGWHGRYCLHVDDEENGSAIRIMHSTGHTLSPGALIHCQIGRTTKIG